MELVKGTVFHYPFRRTVRRRYSNSVVNSLIVENFSKGGPTKRAQLQMFRRVLTWQIKLAGHEYRYEPRAHVAAGKHENRCIAGIYY